MRLRAKRPGRATPAPEEAGSPGAVRQAALALLARRDHATGELARKLRERGFESQAIAAVVEDLAAGRFLDDERFVEHFIAYHAGRGQGPHRISAELRQAGVSAETVSRQLKTAVDWRESARVARRKKFGSAVPRDFKSRARQARFLEYRGFSSDHIRAALDGDVEA